MGQLPPILAVPGEWPQLKVMRSVKDVSAATRRPNVGSGEYRSLVQLRGGLPDSAYFVEKLVAEAVIVIAISSI